MAVAPGRKNAISSDAREGILSRLAELRKEHKMLPGEHLRSAAVLLGISPRHVLRLLADAQGNQSEETQGGHVLSQLEKELYFACRGNVAAVHDRLVAVGAGPPTVRTLQRAVKREFTNGERAFAREGAKGMQRYSLHPRYEVPHRGHTFVIDCWRVDVWTSAGHGAQWECPWAIVVLDARHRAIMGWLISFQHRKEEVLATLRRAFEVVPAEGPFGGLPYVIRWDNALEFLADAVTETLKLLDIYGDPIDGYSPWQNGKLERLFRTFSQRWASQQPFYTHGPRAKNGRLYGPDLPAISHELLIPGFGSFVHFYNFERPHSALGGKTPAQSWEEDPTPLRLPSPGQLRWIEMPSTTRIVQKDGIHFDNVIFAAPELNGLVGEVVDVRFFPHARESVEVFVDGTYVTTASDQMKLTDTARLAILKQRKVDRERASALMRKTSRSQRALLAQSASPTSSGAERSAGEGWPSVDSDGDELAEFDLLGLARRRPGSASEDA
jgi:putative transposase